MRDRIVIFVIALAGGLAGANVPPSLSGLGKIFFPETSPPIASPASIGAASGAITVAAGGANQNVTLSPSGTGITQALTALLVGASSLAPSSTFTIHTAANHDLAVYSSSFLPDGVLIQSADDAVVNRKGMEFNASQYRFDFGQVGIGVNPAHALDVTGDVNATGVYMKGGTSGTSAAYTFPCSGSVTSSGGIVTAAASSSGGATGALTLTLSTQTIQYKDWASANQSATVVTNVTLTTNSFTAGCRTL